MLQPSRARKGIEAKALPCALYGEEICAPFATLIPMKGGKTTTMNTWLDSRIVLAIAAALLSVLPSLPAYPAHAQEGDIPSKHIVLRGSDWLNGHGVDVFYFDSPCAHSGCKKLQPLNTCAYECVDLAVRLYHTLGYPNWILKDGSLIVPAHQMIDTATTDPKGFEDLEFYPNETTTTPPRPGDLVVWSAAYNRVGHVAVINRVMGAGLEVVQQNMCMNGEALYLQRMSIAQDERGFSLTAAWDGSRPAGWIRSPRMKDILSQHEFRRAGELQWNRDGDTVYVYLSPRLTQDLASVIEDFGPINDIVHALKQDNALAFTDGMHVFALLVQAAQYVKHDARFNPERGVRSVDITLKYTGRKIWIRPWGGPEDGKWIPVTIP